jgi:hypothetical protein
MIIDEEIVHTIIAGIITQAYKDWRAGYTRPGIPDAATFLRACGLLRGDTVDERLCDKAVKRSYARRRRNEVTG